MTGIKRAQHRIRRARKSAAVRGIFLTAHRRQLPDPLPSAHLHCAFAPFQELFPRCAAVVHHGGIGTTARVLAAFARKLEPKTSFIPE